MFHWIGPQVSKEENVNEFLKLCANADDRQQHTRMKQVSIKIMSHVTLGQSYKINFVLQKT